MHLKLRWFFFQRLDSRVLRQANKTARNTCKHYCLSACSELCETEKTTNQRQHRGYKLKNKRFIKCFLKQSQIMKYSQRTQVKTRTATYFCSRNTVFFPCSCGRFMNFSHNVVTGLVTNIFARNQDLYSVPLSQVYLIFWSFPLVLYDVLRRSYSDSHVNEQIV